MLRRHYGSTVTVFSEFQNLQSGWGIGGLDSRSHMYSCKYLVYGDEYDVFERRLNCRVEACGLKILSCNNARRKYVTETVWIDTALHDDKDIDGIDNSKRKILLAEVRVDEAFRTIIYQQKPTSTMEEDYQPTSFLFQSSLNAAWWGMVGSCKYVADWEL
ncbi:hypothetical protein MJO28_002122 [Puccinia striiformis f. sp. tritici]|uniref:Uncharacterized protein n=1 Tax=Puccinia striiformis f. sp. tritici TaxID=168172 RepID=A0ACC0EVH3_9BASI|nr:hypothetical protein MJO28_002122 [Puccinia striiformis f. sp. tritici]